MTAEVGEILADRRRCCGPLSCVERGPVFCLDREEDAPQHHELTVGIANDAAIEVVEGLEEGDAVVLNPRSALARETRCWRRFRPCGSHPAPRPAS
jgi:hypothetical protein